MRLSCKKIMINFENPFFVKIILKPKKEQTSKSYVQGKMAQVLDKLQDDKLDYLIVVGNVAKIVPIWKIGSIINLTKEYTSKVKADSEKLEISSSTLKILKSKKISLVVSFKEDSNIASDISDYVLDILDKKYIELTTSEVGDLESMIKLYKSTFDVESVELLKLD